MADAVERRMSVSAVMRAPVPRRACGPRRPAAPISPSGQDHDDGDQRQPEQDLMEVADPAQQLRQKVTNSAPEHHAPERAHAAEHRNEQEADRLVDGEALHADERDIVREQAAGEAAEQRAQHEHARAQPLQIDGEAHGRFARIAHGAQHQSGAAADQVAQRAACRRMPRARRGSSSAPAYRARSRSRSSLGMPPMPSVAAGEPVPFVEQRAADDARAPGCASARK